MITQEQILQLVKTIVDIEQPEYMILFGSYAHGQPRDDSDVDILVVKEYATPRHKRGCELFQALAYVRFPLDLLFYTPVEIAKWRQTPLAFITTVLSTGKVVYDRKHRTGLSVI